MADNKPSGKLVRDRIPEIIMASGKSPITRILDQTEYKESLLEKLNEEVLEVQSADAHHVAEEIADILEVLMALSVATGLNWDEIEQLRLSKIEERGRFEKRIWLQQEP
jgi:predicted house-cleaning noncanonical NTP pyrophosphatase (MazG superfamily)